MTTIRPMQPADKEAVLAMMEVFYASPAVLSNGSAAIFSSDSAVPVSGWKTFISKRIFVEPALEAYFWNLLKKSILKPSFAWK